MNDFSTALNPDFASFLDDRRRSSDESRRDCLIRIIDAGSSSLRVLLGTNLIPPTSQVDELVVGGGLHGTIYAANRLPRVTVYDQQASPSIFGLAERPVFYVNSRNRPEADYRRPGSPGPLNSIVGGIFQPSELNMLEYQSQAELALAIRINLVNSAALVRGIKVVKVEITTGEYRYKVFWQREESGTLKTGITLTNRIVMATGLGEPIMPVKSSERVWSFTEFLTRMGKKENSRPLRDYKRIAIIGAGDSGKVAAEWFLGLGPQPGRSSAAEDFVERLVWIGQDNRTKEDWEACERSRYIGLGRSFPRMGQPNYYYRIQPEPGRALRAVGSSKTVRVDWMGPEGKKSERFDLAIFCTGFKNAIDEEIFSDFDQGTEIVRIDGQAVARQYVNERIYIVGPAAELDLEEREINPNIQVPENTAAAFRYADKTALFAKSKALRFAALKLKVEQKTTRGIFINPTDRGPIFPLPLGAFDPFE